MNLEIEIEKAKAAVVSYTQHNDIQALNEAIEIYKSILSNNNFIITYNNVVVVVLNGIGIAYWYRYRAIGKLTDLENSIYYYRKAVNLTPDDSPYLPNLLNDLSLGLSVRYASSGELADLEESISLKKKVVKLNPDDYPDFDFPKSLNNLAVGLRDLCLHTGELSYLKSSISYWEKAINMTPKGSYDLLGFFSNLGNGIRELYLLGDKLADLEKKHLLLPNGSEYDSR
jgi:tetratricopeptide (TPR) repeat protein